MKNIDFKNFLFKSAVMAMACDGDIAEEEIAEIKNIVANEIYFMGFEFERALKEYIDLITLDFDSAMHNYLQEISANNLKESQEILLVEVVLRVILADQKVEESELKFLHRIKSKLKIEEEALMMKFPQQINYLIDVNNSGAPTVLNS
jgi:uncharacterized tellurite resistance protein B-like protein